MPGIAIEFVLSDLPSKSTAFTKMKHEARQVDSRPATYIPCHDTSPPKHQILEDTTDESILQYVQKMKIDAKAKQLELSTAASTKRSHSSPTTSRKKKKKDSH
ncbi:hypothetical protein Unana1_08034 [Umbelopsis nana]